MPNNNASDPNIPATSGMLLVSPVFGFSEFSLLDTCRTTFPFTFPKVLGILFTLAPFSVMLFNLYPSGIVGTGTLAFSP